MIHFLALDAYNLYHRSYHAGGFAIPRKFELTFQRGTGGRWKKFYRGKAYYLTLQRTIHKDIVHNNFPVCPGGGEQKATKVQFEATSFPVLPSVQNQIGKIFRTSSSAVRDSTTRES